MGNCFHQTAGYLTLAIRVKPRSNKLGPLEVMSASPELKWGVKAAPVDGQANAELEKSIAEYFGTRSRDVKIIRGQTSRSKVVAIYNLELAKALQRLSVPLDKQEKAEKQ